ncbi:hypothetical protein BT69DRAFT_234157 [Atractiella rhizophila]|nr:hypothetical protein BT69DRAFT_234157 [Atractiella rhizophila]
MHKWAFAHRAAALFYCKRERQWNTHSMPISHFYHSPEHPSAEPARDPKEWQSYWVGEFEWIGTQDWSPILSIPAALDFRENVCGGEERIRCWCNNLAKNAGVEMARIFGERSIVMQNEEETLIASMVNISLPLKVSDNASVRAKQREYMIEQMLQHTFFIAIFFYDGRLWLRASAQVYTELHMFISAAEMIKEWCKIAADFQVELDESDS